MLWKLCRARAPVALSDFQIQQQNVCPSSYFLPFTQLLMLQPEALTSFSPAFSSFMLSPLSLLFLLGKEGLPQQQGEEGVQLWFELLFLETIVAG